MATIADLASQLTSPATGDKIVVRDVSAASGDKDKYMLLSQLGVLALAQTWTTLQTFSAGISFGNETLSVYDEGPWSPVVADATSGGNTATTTTAEGFYTKIGNVCNASGFITGITTTGMTGSNQVIIRGLPFASKNSTNYRANTYLQVGQITFTNLPMFNITSNATYANLQQVSSGGGVSAITVSALTSGSASMVFSVTYLTS